MFGSGGCGKKSLKRQWFDGSHSPVLSEIADIHIRIQVNRSVGDRGVCLFQLCIDHNNLSVYNNKAAQQQYSREKMGGRLLIVLLPLMLTERVQFGRLWVCAEL